MTSRDKILQKIAAVRSKRTAAIYVTDYTDEEIYRPIGENKIATFQSEVEAVNGKCYVCTKDEIGESIKKLLADTGVQNPIYCRDKQIQELLNSHHIAFCDKDEDFEGMQAGITSCEKLIARTGSVIVSSAHPSGRSMNAFPPLHLILANESQLVDYLQEGLESLKESYGSDLPSCITVITGPSRTADIEKTLVLGAHGPKELAVFILRE